MRAESASALVCLRSVPCLKDHLQAELDGASATRSQHRVDRRRVRCRATAAEKARTRGIGGERSRTIAAGSVPRVGKVGMVEHVEEFRPELRRDSFLEVEILRDREVQVAVAGVAEYIPAQVTEGSKGRRNHDRAA